MKYVVEKNKWRSKTKLKEFSSIIDYLLMDKERSPYLMRAGRMSKYGRRHVPPAVKRDYTAGFPVVIGNMVTA